MKESVVKAEAAVKEWVCFVSFLKKILVALNPFIHFLGDSFFSFSSFFHYI